MRFYVCFYGGQAGFNVLIMEILKTKHTELFIIVSSIFLVSLFLYFITSLKIFHSDCRQSQSQHQKPDKYTLGALTGTIFEY